MHPIRPLAFAALFALSLPPAGPAGAISLLPGSSTGVSGTTAAARPELAGVTADADIVTPFSANGISGTVNARVVKETGANTLDFYWQVTNDALSNGGISFLVTEKFTGFATDVDFRTDSTGSVGVASVLRIASGEELRFDFAGPILPGESSHFFFAHTNATSFDALGTAFVGINFTPAVASYEPVPEPGTAILFAASLAGLAAALRRP